VCLEVDLRSRLHLPRDLRSAWDSINNYEF
jgi:hypothetical protein